MVKKKSDGKKWWKSKTIWANIFAIGGAVASAITGIIPGWQGWAISALPAANIILRVISTEAIKREWK